MLLERVGRDVDLFHPVPERIVLIVGNGHARPHVFQRLSTRCDQNHPRRRGDLPSGQSHQFGDSLVIGSLHKARVSIASRNKACEAAPLTRFNSRSAVATQI